MASLRRSNAMQSDTATSRFLYTILKQLDHKSIDWNSVASDLDITNGHAARMRFSRFRQHMEGIPPTPRKPRSEGRPRKKAKTGLSLKDELKGESDLPDFTDEIPVKFEPIVKPEPAIKEEPIDDFYSDRGSGPPAAMFADIALSQGDILLDAKPTSSIYAMAATNLSHHSGDQSQEYERINGTDAEIKMEPSQNN